MAEDTQLPAAERSRLLTESLTPIVLAQDVSNTGETTPPDGWEFVASSTDNEPEANVNGFFARVYKRSEPVPPGQAKYAVAFRGTNSIEDLKDIFTDAEIALRILPDQYAQALEFVERVCKEKNIDRSGMDFTGDSLGGYLAITVGTTLGARKIWAFNSPGPTEAIKDELEQKIPDISKPPGANLVQVRSVDDLISEWQYDQGIIIGVKTAGDSHTLSNLRLGIINDLNGKPPEPAIPLKKYSLAWFFNRVTKPLAHSKRVRRLFRRLEANDPHHRQPPPPPPADKNPVTAARNPAAILSRVVRRVRRKPS